MVNGGLHISIKISDISNFPGLHRYTFFVQTRISRIKVNDLKTDPKNRSVFDARTQTKSNSSFFRDGLAMSKSCWSSDESLEMDQRWEVLGVGELNRKRSRRKKGPVLFFALNNGLNMTIITEVPTSNYHW